jgi:capsular polysaccharide transport system ATP-binding protein
MKVELNNISKSYKTRTGLHKVLKNINWAIHSGDKVGILGKNGAGKSTLVRILSGAERADSGSIQRNMTISWPLAFGGAFQNSLTGLDNLKFICRIYGIDHKEKLDYVQDFTELGKYFKEPVKTYSAGMRSRLAFAISMAIEFDCFLIDEIISVGDRRFHDKCQIELFEKRADRSFIIVSHEVHNIQNHCEKVGILNGGQLNLYSDINEALSIYQNDLL